MNQELEKKIRIEEAEIRRQEESALKRRIREEVTLENEMKNQQEAASREELTQKLAQEAQEKEELKRKLKEMEVRLAGGTVPDSDHQSQGS